jgi:hypothetical protein
MAAPVHRGHSIPVITTGAVSSPSSTLVGDLLIFYVWSQGTTAFPTHTLTSGQDYFEWLTWEHNDGSTDGRFSVAVKEAAVAGAQSYTPYSISGATANGTSIGVIVLEAGTWDAVLTSAPPASQSAISQTNNAAPNPPARTGLTGDFLMHIVGAWHQSAAANTDANAPTNYVMRAENSPGTSHLAHLAICDRTLTGLSGATEDAAAITDNIAPNGTVAYSVAIPGAVVAPVDLAGAAAGSGSAAGAVQVERNLAGASAGAGAAASLVEVERLLAGAAAGSGDVAGSLDVTPAGVELAGAAGGEGTAAGELEVVRILGGSAAGAGSAAGSAEATRLLGAAGAGAGAATAGIEATRLLGGQAAGAGDSSANITTASEDLLAGQATGSGAAAASLELARLLAGAAAGAAGPAAAVIVERSLAAGAAAGGHASCAFYSSPPAPAPAQPIARRRRRVGRYRTSRPHRANRKRR